VHPWTAKTAAAAANTKNFFIPPPLG